MELTQEEKGKLDSLKSRIAENVFQLGEMALQEEDVKSLMERLLADKKELISLISNLQKEIGSFVDEMNAKSEEYVFNISTGEFEKK